MKISFFALALVLIAGSASAQSKTHKLGISLGGGLQSYIGERGNAITHDDLIFRGVGVVQAGYYINKSFDVTLFGSMGDFGYCPDDEAVAAHIDDEEECPGCPPGTVVNLSGRITGGGLGLRYKFANGYILKETSRIQPYIYAGAAVNYVSDPMKMNCIRVGDYMSYNAGAGVKYYITDRINLGYNIGFGYLNRDDLDYMTHGTANDMYVQNTIMIGIDLF
jgi:opacity protein-like surface antigen